MFTSLKTGACSISLLYRDEPIAMTLLDRLRYKITHLSKFPKGNLVATLRNLANRGFTPTHIVDIGANRGKWSLDAQAVFPDCAFTLIEPQVEMKRHLDRFCRRSHNCQWIQAGAGSENGTLTFTICPDTVSSSFSFTGDQATRSGYPQREVPVFTLDHIIDQHAESAPEIIKIDAEGFEHEVLLGARNALKTAELVFLETHMLGDDEHPCSMVSLTQTMSEFGYAPYDFTWFGKRPGDEGAIGLCEVVFARKNGVLRNTRTYRASMQRAA